MTTYLTYSNLNTYTDVFQRFSVINDSGTGDTTPALNDGTQPDYVRLHSVLDFPGLIGPGSIAALDPPSGVNLHMSIKVLFDSDYAPIPANYARVLPEYIPFIASVQIWSGASLLAKLQIPSSVISSYDEWFSYEAQIGGSALAAVNAAVAAGTAQVYVVAEAPAEINDPYPDGPLTNAQFEIWVDELRLFYPGIPPLRQNQRDDIRQGQRTSRQLAVRQVGYL